MRAAAATCAGPDAAPKPEEQKPSASGVPLVYACSGASSAAQLANQLAVRLDRTGRAEMSCIAGVGGDVPSLVRVARSGRAIVVIDGCPLQCAARILQRQGLQPDRHYDLSEAGVPKLKHQDFDPRDLSRLLPGIVAELPGEAAVRPGADGGDVPAMLPGKGAGA